MRKNSGFTLLELMTTIAIIGILAAIAVPTYNKMTPDFALRAATRDLFDSMQWARMEAIKQRRNINIDFTASNYVVNYVDDSGATQQPRGTVRLSDYKGGIVFDRPDASGPGFPPRVTFNGRGSAPTFQYAYLTNKYGARFFRVGPLMSGIIKMDKWVGGSWVVN